MEKNFSCRLVVKGMASEDDLQKINSRYSGRPLPQNEVFVSRALVCHNLIDRDNERFSEELLDDFARTLPGKSLLLSHKKSELPVGLFFDAYTEEMDINDFSKLTGEFLELPPGVKSVKVLWGKSYLVAGGEGSSTADLIHKMECGIIRFISIGFMAKDLVERSGNGKKWLEYVAPGEALEGSLVWLGAQQGAGLKGANHSGRPDRDGTADNPLIPGQCKAAPDDQFNDNPLIPSAAAASAASDNPLIPGGN